MRSTTPGGGPPRPDHEGQDRMAQASGTGNGSSPAHVRVRWDAGPNEKGQPILWLGAWLVGNRGEEGVWFHSGRGASLTEHAIPDDATGIRIRRWPNEGLSPEYVDLVKVWRGAIDTTALDFDKPQPFSVLSRDDHKDF